MINSRTLFRGVKVVQRGMGGDIVSLFFRPHLGIDRARALNNEIACTYLFRGACANQTNVHTALIN